MGVGEPWAWTAAETASAVRRREASPLEVLESVLGRIDEVEPELQAFVHVDREGAYRQAALLAREAEDDDVRGPLHGVPVAIKDIFDVEGLPTRCGSLLYDDVPPAASDASVVARLKAAGAVVVGKTATHELACGVYTSPTRNPWDLDRCCGGSSGGSGSAVAAGAAMAATGSDTGGSIRIPASVCGLVGLKPTYDLLSRRGVAALSWTLDHVGPLTRTVDDAALMLEAMADPARIGLRGVAGEAERSRASLDGVVLGVPVDGVLARVHPDVAALFETACRTLTGAGARLVRISVPELEETLPVEFAIVMAEAASYHAAALRERPEAIDPGIRTLFRAGALLPSEDYLRAQRLRSAICAAVDRAFREHGLDAICSPTLPLAAWGHADETVAIDGVDEGIQLAAVRTTAPFNLTGLPAISVPMGLTTAGLPAGLQLAGRAYAEARLLAIARVYEARNGWERTPRNPARRAEAAAR